MANERGKSGKGENYFHFTRNVCWHDVHVCTWMNAFCGCYFLFFQFFFILALHIVACIYFLFFLHSFQQPHGNWRFDARVKFLNLSVAKFGVKKSIKKKKMGKETATNVVWKWERMKVDRLSKAQKKNEIAFARCTREKRTFMVTFVCSRQPFLFQRFPYIFFFRKMLWKWCAKCDVESLCEFKYFFLSFSCEKETSRQ